MKRFISEHVAIQCHQVKKPFSDLIALVVQRDEEKSSITSKRKRKNWKSINVILIMKKVHPLHKIKQPNNSSSPHYVFVFNGSGDLSRV